MALQTEEALKASFRSRHPVVVWTCCVLTCFFSWQFASASLKVAGAERHTETGLLANYDQYMWDSAYSGFYFIAADYAFFVLCCVMELGSLLSSYLAPDALWLILTGPPFFYAAWQFYRCQRDIVMEGVANSCVTLNIPVSYSELFSFDVTCAEEYAYALSSRLASSAWCGAISAAGIFFLLSILLAVLVRFGFLIRAEVPTVPNEEAQELLNEKM